MMTGARLLTLVPGPDRKRSARSYLYQLTYQNPDPHTPGCVMTWEVCGGRLSYQLAIERDGKGHLHCHCTCADAVFRAEGEGRSCKHVLGFFEATRQLRGQQEVRRGA